MTATTTTHHESNRSFYDRIANAYDMIANSSEKPARLAGLNALELKKGEKVLEIGFGTGNEIIDLAEQVGPAGQVAGIDISTGMLAVTQRKLADKGLTTPIDLRVADARQLPFADGSFDAAYSSFTLELFPEEDLPVVLAEARRVLRDGGRLSVVSMAHPKQGQRPSILERTYVWMHRHFPHIVDCRPIDLHALVTAAGFQVAKQIDMEIWTLPVAAVVATRGTAGGK
jgi:demethylmenaquinone methyltransferase/2-methoxy-6-polyprenyl-1,4-benzoquinol methylase